MHKLAISAALLALAGPELDREMGEYRQLKEAQKRRDKEIEFICSDVLASMGFSRQGRQEDNSAVNCELVFGDGSSTHGSNRIETMQAAANYQCVMPEVAAYKLRKPTPKKPMCWGNSYPIDFSSDDALFNASNSCSDFGEPPANTITQDRWCHRIEAVVANVEEDTSYGNVACSCVHAEAVVTDERKGEFDLR